MQKRIVLFFLLTNLFLNGIYGKVTKEDYQRGDSTKHFSELVYHTVDSLVWIDSTYFLWYKTKTQKGDEYFLINAKKQNKKEAFDQDKLCNLLNLLLDTNFKSYSLPIKILKFSKNLEKFEFVIDSFKFCYDISKNKILKIGKYVLPPSTYWGNSVNELDNKHVKSADSIWLAYIQKFNIYIKNRKNNKVFQLTKDGNEKVYYSSYLDWSPDSKYLKTTKVKENPKKYMVFVESSPENQFLPYLHKYEYLRPGDSVRVRYPVLFNIKSKKQIPIETSDYNDQYYLFNTNWRDNSKAFTFEYNQRGHQLYQVVSVNAETGEKKVIVNETSKTFIDYSSKHFRYDIEGGEKIIWASERDGWNHLYLFDAITGELINQITKGEWVVRGIDYVDTIKDEIIFQASGMNNDEDPYFIHYYKIKFDGSGLVDLTPEKYDHTAFFSYDFQFMIDNYSKVDVPPVSVLRDVKDGKVLMEVEMADITDLLEAGYKIPEPFMTYGRDGKTEIWGNIYKPTNFDPTKNYPVIEYIYAGPHSSFVQKSFSPYSSRFSGLAELGFIIVQIDGMGTSNRSKAFHDVCYKNLKDAGYPDRIIWIKAAAEKYKYMDISKVGIFGGSAGGQSSTGALLFHPEFYKVAVSACGCHDNRMDKIWWNEQWMGYPIDKHYSECSNIDNASKLKGDLMLIVGEIDNNVDPSSTYRLADALIKAKKEFELVILPSTNHTLGGEYGERKRRDFFVKHILEEEPPSWNE